MKQKQMWSAIAALLIVGVSYQNCAAPLDGGGGATSGGLRVANAASPTPTISVFATPTPPGATPAPTPPPGPATVNIIRYLNESTNDHSFAAEGQAGPAGYRPEGTKFKLFRDQGANMQPLFNCSASYGYHLVVTSVTNGVCEYGTGAGFVNPVLLGYISISQVDGTVPLVRRMHSNAEYYLQLTTIDEGEFANGGYAGGNGPSGLGWVLR